MSGLDRSSMITPLDEKATVSFSADKTEAYISFSEPRNAGSMLTPDKIKKIIEENNVVHGIDEELVNKIMQGPRVYDHLYTIAKGQKSVDGKNGEIEYLFNFSKKSLSPKMNADGTVDYRNLNLIEMVEKGQVVARAIPPTEGQRGINVFGKEIAANDGRPAPSFPKGKNVVVSGDGAELIAEATGQIVMVNGSVSISEILEIKGNVDNSTGNIDFNGSVVVNGSVIQGFRITCLGNIEVKGSVEGAEIECPGNLIADKGILGMHRANIKVGGSVYARMIQDAVMEVGGDIVSDGIMHCTIKCGGRIELKGKKGILVGGSVSCKESVEVSIIGSPLGTQTEVKVGLDAKVFENYKTLMEEFQLFKKQYEDMSKDLVVMSKIDNINNMPEFKKKSYIKTLYEAKHIQEAMKEKQALIMSLKTELDKYKYSGKIVTESIVYPGVNVQLGNAVLAIRDQLPRCRFTNEEGRVKVAYNF